MKLSDVFKKRIRIDGAKTVTLEQVVEELVKAQRQGKDVYYDYYASGKPVRLYAKGISVDSAYKQVYGCTKEEYKKHAVSGEEAESAIDLVDEWITKGKLMIFPERYEAWEKFVYQSVNGAHYGLEVEGVLRVMNELATGVSVEEVVERISEDPIACEYERFASQIFLFSKRGPEFYEKTTDPSKLNQQLMFRIEEMKKENAYLEQKYAKVD